MNKYISDKAVYIGDLLCSNGEMDIRQIREYTHLKDSVIFMAVGWLMKEGCVQTKDRNGRLYFSPKKNRPEIYY